MIAKTIKFLSISLLSHKERGFFLILMPSEIVSGSFQPALAPYSLFRVVPYFRSNDVTECFDLNFYFKANSCRFLLQSGTSGITKQGTYYKLEQIVIQNAEAATGGVLLKKGVLRNFVKFTRKHLRQSLLFIKFQTPGL